MHIFSDTKYFLRALVLAFALAECLALPVFAHADNINVVFQASPLFSDSNIAPGDTVTRTVTVTNTSGAAQDVYVKALNGVSTGSLGDKLLLSVNDGSTTTVNDLPLSTLTNGAQELIGSDLADGATDTYDFSIYFDPSAGDSYQGSTLSFDLCVGFVGDSSDSCISNSSSGGGGTSGGGDGGGGSGGGVSSAGPGLNAGSNGPISLIQATNAPPPTSASNPTAAGGIPNGTGTGGNRGTLGFPGPQGIVLGASTTTIPSAPLSATSAGEVLGSTSTQVAAAAASLSSRLEAFLAAHRCVVAFLVMLVLTLLGWFALETVGDYQDRLTPRMRTHNRIIYFILATILALIAAIVWHFECDVIPLLFILAALVCWFIVERIRAW